MLSSVFQFLGRPSHRARICYCSGEKREGPQRETDVCPCPSAGQLSQPLRSVASMESLPCGLRLPLWQQAGTQSPQVQGTGHPSTLQGASRVLTSGGKNSGAGTAFPSFQRTRVCAQVLGPPTISLCHELDQASCPLRASVSLCSTWGDGYSPVGLLRERHAAMPGSAQRRTSLSAKPPAKVHWWLLRRDLGGEREGAPAAPQTHVLAATPKPCSKKLQLFRPRREPNKRSNRSARVWGRRRGREADTPERRCSGHLGRGRWGPVLRSPLVCSVLSGDSLAF